MDILLQFNGGFNDQLKYERVDLQKRFHGTNGTMRKVTGLLDDTMALEQKRINVDHTTEIPDNKQMVVFDATNIIGEKAYATDHDDDNDEYVSHAFISAINTDTPLHDDKSGFATNPITATADVGTHKELGNGVDDDDDDDDYDDDDEYDDEYDDVNGTLPYSCLQQ